MHKRVFLCLAILGFLNMSDTFAEIVNKKIISLPKPTINETFSLDKAIEKRRSVRNFKNIALTQEQISNLLWAAQGITEKQAGLRTAPSAGALYPLQLYVVKNDGVWSYLPHKHSLKKIIEQDLRDKLSDYSLYQNAVKLASINIVITADYNVTAKKYGDRAIRYTHIEAGHVAQNILLEAIALGLSSVPIGAFEDEKIQNLLNLPSNQIVLYIIPIGHPNY